MLRGTDEYGENLVIAPDYIYFGMRERLAGIVSLDLGARTDAEDRPLRLEVNAEQLTSIDRRLMRDMDDGRVLRSTGRDMADHAIRTGRLRKLESLGLASELRGGRWRLSDDLEATLRRVAERRGAARTMRRVVRSAGLERSPSARLIHDPSPGTSLTARVLTHGLADEVGKHCLIVDGVDGRSHYIDLGNDPGTEFLPPGAIVRIGPTKSDAVGTVDRKPRITLLSIVPLEQLLDQKGATWLDEELSSPSAAAREQGFGREVRTALTQRRAWLIGQGLAWLEGDQLHCQPEMMGVLKTRAIQQASIAIGQETGLDFKAAAPGSRIEGNLRRRLDLPSGRFAVIEDGHEFSLVPWRPELARAIGKEVSVLVRSDSDISWRIGRSRELEL
jgi:hypothetical protein